MVDEADDDALGKAVDLAHLRRLWPFVHPYRRAFGLALLLLLISFGVELLGPWLLRQAIDGPLTAPAGGDGIVRLGLAYFASTLAGAGLGYAYAMLTTRTGQAVIRDVRAALFAHLLDLDPGFFEKNAAGKLVTRVTSDVENLNELIATGVLQSLFDLLKIFGVLGVLFVVDARLAWFTTLATPVVVVTSLVFRTLARDAYRSVRGRLAKQNAFTAEALQGVRTTRLFEREAWVDRTYGALNESTRQAWGRTVLQFALFFSIVDFTIHCTQVGLLWTGGSGIFAGTLSVGAFVQFWLYFGKVTDPIKELGERYNVLQSAFASAERIFKILDTRAAVRDLPGARASVRGPARLAFEHVDFAYVPGVPVLHDVDFAVQPGETVALVGPTGAGKSTVLALLSRLREPGSGRVTLDDVDLRQLTLDSVRGRIAVVPQDVFLFTGTIRDNVRLFDPAISDARVEAALAATGADELVARLRGGLDARVDERGGTFSQGERQLLSFARALAFDPDVLVLDEATASIDSETEARLQRALKVLLRGRTAVVVAHRLSTVRGADRILVLKQGRIVEAGKHRELMTRDGVYRRMVQHAAAP
ncbi:MAG: ABC transporter ATP-binding protein [Planctomycetota bacterium]